MPNTCVGGEPRGDMDIYDADGNWVTGFALCAACFADYLMEDWGLVFGWARWEWRYGDPSLPPEDPPAEPDPV